MVAIITRHHGMDVTPVATKAYAGEPTLPGALLINPGYYRTASQNASGGFDYKAVDFREPGLYQILVPVNEAVGNIQGNVAAVYNYIVCKVNGVPSPLELAKAFAWLVSFGNTDDPLSAAQTIEKARTSNVNISCGNTMEVVATLANQLGIPTRYVHVLTGDNPNWYNDGHTVLEMGVNNEWKMFDSSLGYVFRDVNANLLNVYETCLGLADDSAIPERIAPFKYTSSPSAIGQFNVLAWMHAEKGYLEESRLDMVKRLYQIPFVNDTNNPVQSLKGIWGFLPEGMEGRASYVTGLGYKLMPKADFIARFYP